MWLVQIDRALSVKGTLDFKDLLKYFTDSFYIDYMLKQYLRLYYLN